MTAVGLLRLDAEREFDGLLDVLYDVTEGQAWAVSASEGPGYLHTNGSILGIVRHLAVCKVMYASAAFRDVEVRWRDCAQALEELGAGWDPNLEYLRQSQAYWLSSWDDLSDGDLSVSRRTNWGDEWPTWQIIATISHHDSYHAGQIALLNTALPPSAVPPPSEVDDMKKHFGNHPTW